MAARAQSGVSGRNRRTSVIRRSLCFWVWCGDLMTSGAGAVENSPKMFSVSPVRRYTGGAYAA